LGFNRLSSTGKGQAPPERVHETIDKLGLKNSHPRSTSKGFAQSLF